MAHDTILQALQALEGSGMVPMHMPGHMRNGALAPYLQTLGATLDITEIHDYDCLHQPSGIILQAMERGRALWHANHSYLLINGSTCGILAAIHSATKPGDSVIMARGCHKAVYNGIALCGLQPHYIQQSQHPAGYCQSVTVEAVAEALTQCPQATLLIITSPTYEGYLSDIAAIATLCHRQGVTLLVDEAHGAHLGFTPYFTGSALQAGADIVVQSLHKTLPSLTQTAIAHVQGTLVSPQQFANSLGIFQTSSPSYLLMASIDSCLHLLQTQGQALFAQWQAYLEDFYGQTTQLKHLSVVQEPSAVKDPSKILISTATANLSGTALKHRLRQDYHIELEMAYGDYALAMTGMGSTAQDFRRLAQALLSIDQQLSPAPHSPNTYQLPHLPRQLALASALHNRPITPLPLETAPGHMCGSYIWAYPPGVPLIVPGEEIDQTLLTLLATLQAQGVDIQDTAGLWPHSIATIA